MQYMHHHGELFIEEDSFTARFCDDILRGGEDTTCATAIDEMNLKVSSHGQYLGLSIDGACIRNKTAEKEIEKGKKQARRGFRFFQNSN